MVRAGGEVGGRRSLKQNVHAAERLAFLLQDGHLLGVAALKNPQTAYREGVRVKSGFPLSADNYPVEFGYLYVVPGARGKGHSRRLWGALVVEREIVGMFATARVDNCEMAVLLPKLGFIPAGDPYKSSRGKYKLQLFLRGATQQVSTSPLPQEPVGP